MKRLRIRNVCRYVALMTVNVGIYLFLARNDVRCYGIAVMIAVVITVIEANRMCEQLAQQHWPWQPQPPVDAPVDALAGHARDAELARIFATLEPRFAELDVRKAPGENSR